MTDSEPMVAHRAPMTRAARLDRLPFTRQHGKLLVGSGIGWALDAMDVGLISFVMAALAAQWQLSPTTLGYLGSIGFVGMALGASLGGLLADRIGRRQVFALTLLVYGIATGASALVGSVGALLVLRFLVGIEEPAMPRLGPARAGLQPGRTPLGEALADVEHPGRAQPDLRRDRVVSLAGSAQPDHLPPAFLLRRRRQLAHVHVLHARDLGRSCLHSRLPRPDQ